MKRAPRRLPYGEVKRVVVESLARGMTVPQIAKATGVHRCSIYSVAYRVEQPINPVKKPK